MKVVAILFFCGVTQVAFCELAQMQVVVVDDATGEPMSNVTVRGIFPLESRGIDAFKGPPDPNVDIQKTDVHGKCTLSGETNAGRAWCEVVDTPQGYEKGAVAAFRYQSRFLGKWRPSDQFETIRLSRCGKGIPLYVKYIGGKQGQLWCDEDFFGRGEGKLELDLVKGDWLPPGGAGEVADIEFERMPRQNLGEVPSPAGGKVGLWRESMKIRFLGEGNGWVKVERPESYLVAIRTSPDRGFVPDYPQAWKERNRNGKIIMSRDQSKLVCFRIRTKLDAQGTVIGGYYGKIYGDIYFLPSSGRAVGMASPTFLYYLNPTELDRNLEWDEKTNLFPIKRIRARR